MHNRPEQDKTLSFLMAVNLSVDVPFGGKKTFFVNIFATKCNLGIGCPASDTCSYSHRPKIKFKYAKMAEKSRHL